MEWSDSDVGDIKPSAKGDLGIKSIQITFVLLLLTQFYFRGKQKQKAKYVLMSKDQYTDDEQGLES